MSNVMMDYYEAAAYLGLSKGTLYAMVSVRSPTSGSGRGSSGSPGTTWMPGCRLGGH